MDIPDPLPLRVIIAPTMAIRGCDCGGSGEWHEVRCSIWKLPDEQRIDAIDAAMEQRRAFAAALGKRLREKPGLAPESA
jgi:hypothetical protein